MKLQKKNRRKHKSFIFHLDRKSRVLASEKLLFPGKSSIFTELHTGETLFKRTMIRLVYGFTARLLLRLVHHRRPRAAGAFVTEALLGDGIVPRWRNYPVQTRCLNVALPLNVNPPTRTCCPSSVMREQSIQKMPQSALACQTGFHSPQFIPVWCPRFVLKNWISGSTI